MPKARILVGDVIERLRDLPSGSIHCCVTSPPYFGLRDYGVEGQIGLEESPEKYIEKIIEVFSAVRRVLRDDGTLWLNLGDSYAGSGKGPEGNLNKGMEFRHLEKLNGGKVYKGAKSKDLIGIPWMAAFALRADGWWLRRDIIWAKKNCMPESVTDRPTTAHEYMFLLTKSENYYYDAEAVKEVSSSIERPQQARAREIAITAGLTQAHFDAIKACGSTDAGKSRITQNGSGKNAVEIQRLADEAKTVLGGYYREFVYSGTDRNLRSVWHLATEPYKEAHFATYPTSLVRPCIKAGTSEKGCCPKCGAPLERIVEPGYRAPVEEAKIQEMIAKGVPRQKANLYGNPTRDPKLYMDNPDRTTGWQPTCNHFRIAEMVDQKLEPVPCLVLDPFTGSGTTGLVALALGRDFVGTELSKDYSEMAAKRIHEAGPMFYEVDIIETDGSSVLYGWQGQ